MNEADAPGPSCAASQISRCGSVDGCLPYVWVIWGSVLAAAVLGVLKPGALL